MRAQGHITHRKAPEKTGALQKLRQHRFNSPLLRAKNTVKNMESKKMKTDVDFKLFS